MVHVAGKLPQSSAVVVEGDGILDIEQLAMFEQPGVQFRFIGA